MSLLTRQFTLIIRLISIQKNENRVNPSLAPREPRVIHPCVSSRWPPDRSEMESVNVPCRVLISSSRRAHFVLVRGRRLRAVQLLLVHTKLESTVRYLGIEVDDVLEMAEQTEV